GGGFGPSGFGFGDLDDLGVHTRPRRPERPAPPTERVVQAPDGSRLTQRGLDVHSDARLTIDQAVLGSLVDVPTLSGKASVKVPPGTSSGVKLRLKGKGAKGAGGKRGDHLVTVQIDVPKELDEEATRLLALFMQRTRRSP